VRPRFDGDRQSFLVLSFAEGTDNRGMRYHHPAGRLSLDLNDWARIAVDASWVKAAVYQEHSLAVRVRLGGSGSE
jgi:hypothetical protein